MDVHIYDGRSITSLSKQSVADVCMLIFPLLTDLSGTCTVSFLRHSVQVYISTSSITIQRDDSTEVNQIISILANYIKENSAKRIGKHRLLVQSTPTPHRISQLYAA
jgi:hypothetical protein